MEYKRSTFQLGLQARNVNKSEKNHNNGSYCIVISKPVNNKRVNKYETIRDNGREEKRLENGRIENKRKEKIRKQKRKTEEKRREEKRTEERRRIENGREEKKKKQIA